MSASPTTPHPQLSLDGDALKANVHAWRLHVARPVWAVLKSNGYGWGFNRLITHLDSEVAGYCVADHYEFEQVRQLSTRPIIIFSQPPLDQIASIAKRGGHPTVTSLEALQRVAKEGEACGQPLRIRLGLAPALGWFGIPLAALAEFVKIARSRWLEVELWSQLTTPDAEPEERRRFSEFVEAFRSGHVPIAAIDLESSAPAARHALEGERARIGIGLFGAFRSNVPGLQGAIRLSSPIVATEAAQPERAIGLSRRPAPATGTLVTLRIGYGDGLPRGMIGAQLSSGTIIHIGMQYSVLHQEQDPSASPAPAAIQSTIEFFTAATDLHALTADLPISAHEVVVSLGLASCNLG